MAHAPPPWTGMTFTSKRHSAPPASLAPADQTLPSPFVVAITGGSRNIGAATAKAFAQAGATGILITGTKEEALAETKKELEAAGKPGLKVTTLQADVSDPTSAQKLADAVTTEYGRLDLLVNNAAIVSTSPSAFNRIEGIDIDQIMTPMQVNLAGKFASTKHLLPLLVQTDGAKTVVNITSATSHMASRGAIGYNLSELTINRFTEAIAESYGPDGILAFAVHPGIVMTMPAPIGMPAAGRVMCVDDVNLCGAFLVWLVKERRPWLSGRYLSSNWDVEELETKKDEIVSNDKLKMRLLV